MQERRHWMGVLARTRRSEIEALVQNLAPLPTDDVVRPAETGTIMVEGRAGGNGARFNLGEACVTRCVVRVAGRLGFAYALGRDRSKAHLSAKLDAMLQDPERNPELMRAIIVPLAERQAQARMEASRKAAATKVDFFTLIRGDE